jgi:poly(3-hydroxybutyrate) depolymerase
MTCTVHSLARRVAALALSVASARCTSPPRSPRADEQVARRVAPASVDLSSVSSTPGLAQYEFRVSAQGTRTAAIWWPTTSVPRTIVVFLHGAVLRGPAIWSAAAQTRGLLKCLAEPAFRSLRAVIVAPRSETGEWWLATDAAYVLGLVRAAVERWPTARTRVVVAGFSNGGIASWYFARLYPEYFAAGVPIAFNDTVVGPSRIPIYAIQGSNDELFSSDAVRGAVERQIHRGNDISFHEKYRGTHLAPCSYLPELAQAAPWLETHAFAGPAMRAAP